MTLMLKIANKFIESVIKDSEKLNEKESRLESW